RMPYHSRWMEKGDREMIACPLLLRKAKASHTSEAMPRTCKASETIRNTFARSPGAVLPRGAIVQKAKMAERYISVHQSSPDQPICSESGVSFTIKIPIASKDTVRMT